MTCNPFGVELFSDFYNYNDAAKASQIVSERVSDSFVDHAAVFGAAPDKAGFTRSVAFINSAFSQKYNVLKTIEQNNIVVAIWNAEVVHTGQFLHLPPTGKTFRLEGITAYELHEGLVTAHWEKFDVLAMLTALGIVPEIGG
ncbi:ester cyclase [Herbaspirillum huttiense]|uniref:Ester cyclase n=2 Tax=Herbaspirillum huttiense TaxID=863372 RepID=A0AAJ2LUZ6_9BURK|nr:ester cyclase [Herbaspirillum huttiense]MDR9837800.1 ester cyclase [Herbaspirillum huttiense]